MFYHHTGYLFMFPGEGSKQSQSFESRRKQATAIVMMGVLGAEFGVEIEPSKRKGSDETAKHVVEGFGLTKYSHAMHTSKCGSGARNNYVLKRMKGGVERFDVQRGIL